MSPSRFPLRTLPLVLFTSLGCRTAPPSAGPVLVDGMVAIPAGEVVLGTQRAGGVLPPDVLPPDVLPPSGPHPGAPVSGSAEVGGASAFGEGGAGRALGGPPPIVAHARRQVPRDPPPWQGYGGDQLPPRKVRVSAFSIDATEVTRASYRAFLEATGYRPPHVDEAWAGDDSQGGPYNWLGTRPPGGTEDHPVLLVSWYDAAEYCDWAGKRLPTEAEWQLAALGPVAPDGSSRRYPWGDTYDGERLNHGMLEAPNFDGSDGWLTSAPVGSFPSGRSPYGLDDTFGNAWEFTADFRFDGWARYQDHDAGGLFADPRAPGPGLEVAVRGGSFFFDLATMPEGERHAFLPEVRRKTAGFRCAR